MESSVSIFSHKSRHFNFLCFKLISSDDDEDYARAIQLVETLENIVLMPHLSSVIPD